MAPHLKGCLPPPSQRNAQENNMTHPLQQKLMKQQQAAQHKRYAQNLTEALMAKLQIPQGRHLVAILGTGMEHSNAEALTIWVQRMLPLIEVHDAWR